MDDSEYYSKMRGHNLNRDMSWLPEKSLLLKKEKEAREENAGQRFSRWNIEQGREDAEMLAEKNAR